MIMTIVFEWDKWISKHFCDAIDFPDLEFRLSTFEVRDPFWFTVTSVYQTSDCSNNFSHRGNSSVCKKE